MSGNEIFDDSDDDSEEDDEIVVGSEAPSDATSSDDLPMADDTNSIVKPVEDIEEVVETYEQFEELKEKLLTEADVTKISGGVHVNKSGWRKIATAFNLSVETIKKTREVDNGVIRYSVVARAVAPNGKSTTASGMCASNESNHMEAAKPSSGTPEEHDDYFRIDGKWRRLKEPKEVNEHNIMATAETRAKNRAISDLVGGGEVSAEELASKKKKKILE